MEKCNMTKTGIHYDLVPSPLGTVLIMASGDALVGIHFEGERYQPVIAADWRRTQDHPAVRAAQAQLDQYFAGERIRFDLPLAVVGTEFQRAVWQAIGTVPYGATIAYRELAARAGRPGSIRAAGAATGRNRWTIVVPCHRIVGSNGSLTGYAGGLERKRALLALEARNTAWAQAA
jgi:methylated-DNA-[protein]-cysteine S-methyltransferase